MDQEIFKRSLSGLLFVVFILFGITSQLKFQILIGMITFICICEIMCLCNLKYKILGLLYILPSFLILQFFSFNNFNSSTILFFILLTWSFDIFAYLTGKNLGKNKILPSISPNKTWEGFIGGFIMTNIATFILLKIIPNNMLSFDIINIFLLSCFIPITATIGDMVASFLKRKSNKKDFSNLIPGHGGMLDRMDSFMITIPIFYFCFQ